MAPISCILDEIFPICLLRIGQVYAWPVFNHIGADTDKPVPCNCTILTALQLNDPDHICNSFNFLVSFVFYPVSGSGGSPRCISNTPGERFLRPILLFLKN
jgi:hypothetical protein